LVVVDVVDVVDVVEILVVGVTAQRQVVQVGGAAVGPVQDVVSLALGGSAVAAAYDVGAVPGGQGAPLVG